MHQRIIKGILIEGEVNYSIIIIWYVKHAFHYHKKNVVSSILGNSEVAQQFQSMEIPQEGKQGMFMMHDSIIVCKKGSWHMRRV